MSDTATSSTGTDFNPHSPCGERQGNGRGRRAEFDFNPHSPCGERLGYTMTTTEANTFQSTLPMRGAT